MSAKNNLNHIFSSDLRHLMVISYIVLGNNAITNRYIEKNYRMPVHAWSALFAIVTFPGIRAKEIRQLFPRPQNTISRAVSLLESRGLARHETSHEDAREKRLFATTAGAELLAEIRATSVERQEELLAPLTKDERETFFRLALKIAAGDELLNSEAMGSTWIDKSGDKNEAS